MLLYEPLHGNESVPVKLYSLVSVANTSILNEGTKHHEEADKEVNVDGLHVGDLGQSSIDTVTEGCHCQDCGHSKANPSWSSSSVQPKGHP